MRRPARSRLLTFIPALAASALLLGGTSWPAEPTLLDRLLILEEEHRQICPAASAAETKERLGEFTETVQAQMESIPAAPGLARDRAISLAHGQQVVGLLNDFIYRRLGLQPSQDLHDPCNLLLSAVLTRKQGYCVGIAAFYLALADSADLPIRLLKNDLVRS